MSRAKTAGRAPESATDKALELFPTAPNVEAGTKEEIVHLAIEDIAPDPANPRTDADDDLAESIRQEGVLQPITVRLHPRQDLAGEFALTTKGQATRHPKYMIVFGERRYRGSIKAGRPTIPAIIREEVNEDRARRLLRQFQENFHKKLEPLQEAELLKELRDATGYSVEQLEKVSGKPRSTINDRLALADAPAPFKPLFADGVLSAAAAPLIRKYADVPSEILERAVSSASRTWEWNKAIRERRAIALNHVESELKRVILGDEYGAGMLAEVPDKLSLLYQGPKVAIGKKEYATDYKLFEKVKRQQQDEEAREAAEQEKEKASKAKPKKKAELTPAEKRARTAEKKEKEKAAKEAAKKALEDAQWKTAAPAIVDAVYAAIKKTPITAMSAIAEQLYRGMGPQSYKSVFDEFWFADTTAKDVTKLGIGRGKTAEDFLRHITACLLTKDLEMLEDGDEYARQAVTDAVDKLELKVDIRKLLGAVQEPEFDGAKKPAQASGKKRKGKK